MTPHTLFETTSINNLTINNRFIRSATGTGLANEKGEVTPAIINHIQELIEGEVGLIISGHMCVHEYGRTSNIQLRIYNDSHITGLQKMANTVHKMRGKIVAQLNHGGAQASPETIGRLPIGPSHIPETEGKFATFSEAEAMTTSEITQTVDAFGEAAGRAKEAGFDGVQIHCAHGYLLSEFLSQFYNKRTDRYGGTIENRVRMIEEVYYKVRQAVGDEYPVMLKMNVTDFLEDGLKQDDALKAAVVFDDIGFDAIELSGGTLWGLRVIGDLNLTPCRNVKDEIYYHDTAKLFKQKIETPIILTGGILSYNVASRIIEERDADYIGLCRPLIREPGLIKRWKSGDTRDSECVHDNACLLKGGGKCYQI
jgi:2,4-dienoyl-CoA reductase-like NADH-dependent reductase (Old Yellow Enzyme family)